MRSRKDTAKAWQKIQNAYKTLIKKDFAETALQFSEDPNVKENREISDSLQSSIYRMPWETVAYNTIPGKFSNVFRTNGGYIILK